MLARKILKSGDGIPFVFLHGFLGTALDWESVVSHLPFPSIGFDLPGHGHSPFVEDFVIDLPRFHLVGYSLGGRIALGYAKKHPEQVASLTLLSTHPGLTTDVEKVERFANDEKWAKLLLELPIDDFLNRWYDQSLFKPFKPEFSMRKGHNIHNLAKAMLHYSLAKQPRYDVEEILVGVRDEKFRALCKRPILIENAGHAIHLENPKAVAQIIQQKVSL
jgi:2-succinyl-6-hydroxy-2,4-cyclohexadiene-1-carboxylate synthase